jgi:hypothetical protein
MPTKNTTSEKSSGSADEANKNNSNSQLTETTLLENTPFAIVKIEDSYFVACGKYRLTGLMDNLEDAQEYAYRIDWNNITAVIGIIVQAEIDQALGNKTLDTAHRLISEAEEEK